MARVVDGLEVHVQRMAALSGANFSQATDLADHLSLRYGMAFRTAHRIVGTLVRLADERGLAPSDITPALLDQAANQVIGRPLGFDLEALRSLLDTGALVRTRRLLGGPAPEQVRLQIDDAATQRADGLQALSKRRANLTAAEAALFARVRALASGAPIEP